MSTSATTTAAGTRARPAASPGGHVLASSQCSCGAPKSSVETSCDSCRTLMLQPQRLSGAADGSGARAVPPIVGHELASPGQPLDESSRGFFEGRFRRDLGQVRIHTGSRAADSARSIGARAYTSGHHVVFGRGEYRPGSDTTRRLLAHELTHVVQQRAGRKSDAIDPPGSPAEREADGNERRVMAGEAPLVRERATGISRACAASSAGEHMTGEDSNAEDCDRRQQQKLGRDFNRAGDWICQATDKLRAVIRDRKSSCRERVFRTV